MTIINLFPYIGLGILLILVVLCFVSFRRSPRLTFGFSARTWIWWTIVYATFYGAIAVCVRWLF